MQQPLVSVKMITYNHAPFIRRAIESVLQQRTNFSFELVIGEDCSTDGTREIAFDYQKKYPDIIRVVTSDRNVGMRKNSTRTLKACRGKYVAYCEGDDFWQSPEKLQKQADKLERDPKPGWIFSDYDMLFEKDRRLVTEVNRRNGFRWPGQFGLTEVIGPQGGAIRTCTVMVRTDLLRRVIDADPYLHTSEQFLMGDTQLFAELMALTQPAYCPESLATYRILQESATRSADLARAYRFWASSYEMKLYLCEKYRLGEGLRAQFESDLYCSKLRLAFFTKDAALADDVRRRKKRFTWKEWIRYAGVTNSAVRRLYLFLSPPHRLWSDRHDSGVSHKPGRSGSGSLT